MHERKLTVLVVEDDLETRELAQLVRAFSEKMMAAESHG